MLSDWRSKSGRLKIGLASDHGGFDKKNQLMALVAELGYEPVDFGPFSLDPADDYPDFANPLCQNLMRGNLDCGILICRSGIGMSIIANRFHGLRAALCETVKKAASSREHNDSNILVTGGDAMTDEELQAVVKTWLATPFSNDPRHVRRLEKLEVYSYDDIAALRNNDPELTALIDQEAQRQSEGLELIASENFASCAVRAAQGSVLTNKYAEGLPGKRYYNGCKFVDQIEQLAIDRAKALFGAEAANVQPHSGSQANQEVYYALLQPGDTVLGMSLDCGGHLSHGLKANFSGRTYNFIGYGVDAETEQINYDALEELAVKEKPKMILAGASARLRTRSARS